MVQVMHGCASVVELLDFVTGVGSDGQTWCALVFEKLDFTLHGTGLAERLASAARSIFACTEMMRTPLFQSLKVHDRANFARQLCEIVVALHSRGVVVVDLKPSNVMVKQDVVHVLKVVDADSWRHAEQPIGAITGGGPPQFPDFTPLYAAIELLRAWDAKALASLIADPAMDLYSLGLMLAMLLSPSCAPAFVDDAAALAAARAGAAPPTSALVCSGSEYARELVTALISVDPRARPSLALLLDKNKFLNAGVKSMAAHSADSMRCSVVVGMQCCPFALVVGSAREIAVHVRLPAQWRREGLEERG